MQTEQRQPESWTRAFGLFVGFVTLFAAMAAGSIFVRAGWEKLDDPMWTGEQAGMAITGFTQGASFKSVKTEMNPYPDALAPMRTFNEQVVARHAVLFSWLVVWGEVLAPLAVITLCCVRFRGSRSILVLMASLAASMNLVYLHQGSSGSNPAMLLMWLTVIWVAATMPRAALAYAISLNRSGGQPVAERPASAGLWVFFGVVLVVLGVECAWITSARETVVYALGTGGLAAVLAFGNARLSVWSGRGRSPRLSGDGQLQTA
jgi:thiosulfate dehydrogenase (quinone) large subunit